jgi:cystine transport system ATP-binding protein
VFLDAGSIVEKGPAPVLFSNPERQRTRRFIATLKQEAEKDGGGDG